jgi:hypothetical protein
MFPASNNRGDQSHASGVIQRTGGVMRRIIGFVLVAIGIFGIALAPLFHFAVLPKVEQFPLDENFTDYASGQGSYLDFSDLTMKTDQLMTVCRTAIGDVQAGVDAGAAVWDVVTYLHTPDQEPPDQKPCGSTDKAWNVTVERWAFNRHTVQAVDVNAQPDFGDTNAYLVFPFNVDSGTTYNYWDASAKASFPAKYQGTEEVNGLTVDKFMSVVPPTLVLQNQPLASVFGNKNANAKYDVYFSNPESVALVDPLTGIVVGGSSHLILTAREKGSSTDAGNILDVQLTERADSVKTLTELAVKNGNKLTLIGTTIPIVSLIVGVIALIVGIWLLSTAGRSRAASGGSDTAPATSGTAAT